MANLTDKHIELQKQFKENKYCVVKNCISLELAHFLFQYSFLKEQVNIELDKRNLLPPKNHMIYEMFGMREGDSQSPNSFSNYGDMAMDALLATLTSKMKSITGLNLIPAYSYFRIYSNGHVLRRHKDRASCEVSTTLCLGYTTKSWPIYIDTSGEKGKKGISVDLKPGDMMVYRGVVSEHWREAFDGDKISQVFLHYNDIDGPFKDNNLYDCRPQLGMTSYFKDPKKMEIASKIEKLVTSGKVK